MHPPLGRPEPEHVNMKMFCLALVAPDNWRAVHEDDKRVYCGLRDRRVPESFSHQLRAIRGGMTGRSSTGEKREGRPDRASIQGICDQAKQDRRVAILLEQCLNDPIASRVLLLHRTEMFPRLTVPVEGTALTISAGGIPFLSHAPKDIRRSLKSLACKYAAYSRHPERATVAQQRFESIEDAVSESIRDAIALAILNTVSANEPLLRLVNGPQPVDRALLRQTVKDYSGINWSPGMAHLMAAFAELWQADRARKPVQY